MKELTSAEFIEKMKTAPEWQIVQGMGTGQLLLATRNTPDDKPVYFLGPHPWQLDTEEYKVFTAAVEDAIAMRSTHDDQSDADIQTGKEST